MIPAIASFFIPGLGQVCNGEGIMLGLLWLIGTLIGFLLLLIPGLIVWFYGIYNAYRVAERMNYDILPRKTGSPSNIMLFALLGLIIYGLYLIFLIFFAAMILGAFIYGVRNSGG